MVSAMAKRSDSDSRSNSHNSSNGDSDSDNERRRARPGYFSYVQRHNKMGDGRTAAPSNGDTKVNYQFAKRLNSYTLTGN